MKRRVRNDIGGNIFISIATTDCKHLILGVIYGNMALQQNKSAVSRLQTSAKT